MSTAREPVLPGQGLFWYIPPMSFQSKSQPAASERRLEADLRVLAEDIGVRLSGSAGEQAAVRHLSRQLGQTGAQIREERFAMRERRVESEELEIRLPGGWRSFACSLFSNTPGTEGQWREAPLVFFEAPAEYSRATLAHLGGKAVVHLGSHIESREHYRRLMEAGPAFLLFVDVRYPGTVPLADGMFPAYTDTLGAVPTLNVAYMDAWEWKKQGALAARLRVRGGMREAESQNLIAEFPGRSPELLLVSGHHDTQADSPGADDNGTGTVALLELARLLGGLGPLRRTVRLVSFGAEEQLSVGSAEYVRRHRAELAEKGRFLLNFDSFGSHLGWLELIAGSSQVAEYLSGVFQRHDLYLAVNTQVMPYADHFPFVAAGLPAASLLRSNCTAGRFFHHRPDDDLSRVSTALLARVLDASLEALVELANGEELPFPARIPAEQAPAVEHCWNDLFGGWQPARRP
jgi:aminopeptidase YwaD